MTWVLLGLSGVACGSRTPLSNDPNSCLELGATRVCENACGSGTQVCAGDHFTPCDIPVVTRACSDACGTGSQTCADGAWGTCDVPPSARACMTQCGAGQEKCIDGAFLPCDAPAPIPPQWSATVRDFTDADPDFESMGGGVDPGIVEPDLGPDDKPVYAGNPTTLSTHGQALFNEWYRDVPSVNQKKTIVLPLSASPTDPSVYVYANASFFPLDNDPNFDKQGREHDYDFTLEVVSQLRYSGGENYSFTADDDLWVFINRKLAVDLGGVHAARTMSISLDALRDELGIVPGGVYPFHLFFAERRVVNSELDIRVTASDFATCP